MEAREGGCRCGQVRFRISAPPLLTSACHCRGCQQMTASVFSLSVGIPGDGFAVIEGEPVLGGLHRPDQQHFFCTFCKSWLFTRIEGKEQFVNVRATMLDEPGDWATPFIEVNTDEKLPWVTTPALRSYKTVPADDVWVGLISEYGRRA